MTDQRGGADGDDVVRDEMHGKYDDDDFGGGGGGEDFSLILLFVGVVWL